MTAVDYHEPQYLSTGQYDQTIAVSTYVGPGVVEPQSVRTRCQLTVLGSDDQVITLGWRQMAQLHRWLEEVLTSGFASREQTPPS